MKIKVVCLNLWIGGILFDPIVDFLKRENPDICLLQEVFDDDNYASLQKQLEFPYSHFAPAFDEIIDDKKVVQGNVILSKFPLHEIGVTYYDVPYGIRDNRREAYQFTPRNLQHVSTTISKTTLHVFNTQGIWGEDGWDSERRVAMAEHIVNEIGNTTPFVLAGDFNLQPKTKTIGIIEKKAKNVFKDELQTSFNIKRKDLVNFPGFATAVVDMIFVSPEMKVISHYCPTVDISDHLPLIVELEIP